MRDARHTLILPRARVLGLATPADYIECVRQAFVDFADGIYAMPAVGHVEGSGGTIHVKSAARRGRPAAAALKLNANFPGNSARGLPTIQGLIALFDATDGRVLALLDSIEITAQRTAAVTALAARHLARADASVLGIVGCGVQARYHLEALLEVLPVREVRFCDSHAEAAGAFAREIESRGLRATRAADPGDTARGADVLVTLTPATQPLIALREVGEGTFVAGVGADNPSKNELAPDLLSASRVVVDLLSQASTMGDLHHAIRAGAFDPAQIHGELAHVVSGRVPGRTAPAQRFVFDSTGVAFSDVAAAWMIYERALRAGTAEAIALNAVS